MVHKLLLADDSVTIQRVIELTFANEDVEVTAVGDGQLAIDRLESGAFDIVLADVDMPKRDGYEVAAYIKSRPRLAHIPVVLLTGAFEPIDQARATASGSSDVLAKPFEPHMVINRVKQLLGKKPDDGNYDVPAPAPFAPSQPVAPQSPQPGAAKQTPGEGGQPVSLDDYFDQLDAAFSNLQPGTASPEHHEANAIDWAAADASDPHVQPNVPQQPPWAEPPKRQMAPTAPQAGPVVARAPEPLITPTPTAPTQPAWKPEPVVASGRSVPQPSPAPPPRPPSPPPVVARPAPAAVARVAPIAPPAPEPPARPAVNPFAELSAAKAEAAARPGAPMAITDEVIEEIVARVLQRLSDRVVRETVTEIVSKTAERAVQEEIERIKTGGQ